MLYIYKYRKWSGIQWLIKIIVLSITKLVISVLDVILLGVKLIIMSNHYLYEYLSYLIWLCLSINRCYIIKTKV